MESFQDFSTSFDADDNMFYQELTRRILMLTDEDDDDDKDVSLNGVTKVQQRPVVYGGVKSRVMARNYYSWSETGRCSVPDWMESLWATGGGGRSGVCGGGTGVFIPSVASTGRFGRKSGRRRHSNKATKNNDRGRVYSVGNTIHG